MQEVQRRLTQTTTLATLETTLVAQTTKLATLGPTLGAKVAARATLGRLLLHSTQRSNTKHSRKVLVAPLVVVEAAMVDLAAARPEVGRWTMVALAARPEVGR